MNWAYFRVKRVSARRAMGVESSVLVDESESVFNIAVPPVLGVVNGLTAVEEVA